MFSRITRRFSFNQLEPCLFALCIILTLWPIVITKYYVTLDGPSHLYNANLVKELIFGGKDNISDLYKFNPVPVPNWSGHFIIAFFNLFLPAFLSEKMMMLIYFILTPLFFRRSILFFEPRNRFGIYFIFPLLHNNLFYFGFFNMCLGITAMLAAFSYFLHAGVKLNIKRFLGLTLLLGVAFFSHIMTFLLTLALLIAFSTVFLEVRKDANRYRISDFSGFKKRLLWVFTCAFPWLILSIYYFIKSYSTGPQPEINIVEHLLWIVDFRPIMAFSYGPPLLNYGRMVSSLFAVVIVVYIIQAIRQRRLFSSNIVSFEYRMTLSSVIFLCFSLILVIMFLLLPNFIMVCDRLLVLSFVFFFSWLAMIRFPRWFGFLSLVVIVYVQTQIISVYYEYAKQSRNDVPKMEELATHIPEGNLVMVLNYSGNWLYNHASGYVGANRRLAVLENYEAGLPWFPVNWNPARYVTDTLAYNLFSNRDLACSYFVNRPDTQYFSMRQRNGAIIPVDYVFQMGINQDDQNPCSVQTRNRLDNSYKIIHENDFCRLYLRKKNR